MPLVAALGLLLIEDQDVAMQIRATERDDVGAALPGIEQEREGEPRRRADRMRQFEARDFRFARCG